MISIMFYEDFALFIFCLFELEVEMFSIEVRAGWGETGLGLILMDCCVKISQKQNYKKM